MSDSKILQNEKVSDFFGLIGYCFILILGMVNVITGIVILSAGLSTMSIGVLFVATLTLLSGIAILGTTSLLISMCR
jgi:hypothetical protein